MNEVVYKKLHKKNLRSKISKNLSVVKYGSYALKSIVSGILTPTQVEASRRVLSRETNRVGKIKIRIKFNYPVTKKPLLSRMGKGSGPIKKWIAIVLKGSIILELIGVTKDLSIKSLKASSIRLPLRMLIVRRYYFKNLLK